ncbi:hypothetical protein acdb102_35860 [Acidothermaceae bacterium B102]|nr:hypothetical protein acdb102_35860 [Acidothermaceae bacterium B102]
MKLTRSAIAAVVAVVMSALPATAARAVTHPARLTLHVTAASFKVGTPVTLTGTATPVAGATVVLERLVGKAWKPLVHEKAAATGVLAYTVASPKKPATWTLRLVRAKSHGSKALTSNAVKVHVVSKAFAITATVVPVVTADSPIVVTGTVTPSAPGSVVLQLRNGTVWQPVATARLTGGSAFSVAVQEPLGAYQLRVVRAATTIATQGIRSGLTTTVALPPLVVSTSTLPDATVRLPYTASVSATGGLPPYTWSATGLPTGLTMAATGVISGTATQPIHAVATLTVTDARSVAASANVSLYALLSKSAINVTRSWGVGGQGELGDGRTADSSSPVVVATNGFVAVSSFTSGAVALRYDGTVWTWGDNGDGQLGGVGVPVGGSSAVPLQVPGLPSAIAVANAGEANYALAADGTVWAWGNNASGELGDGSAVPYRSLPAVVPGLANVTALAGGAETAFALKGDGTLWAWGDNGLGQLGDGTTSNRATPVKTLISAVTHVASGAYAAIATTSDGAAWTWGYNDSGQLGNGTTTTNPTPAPVVGITHVVGVAGGYADSYALTSDGHIYGWGANAMGQVGDGTMAPRLTPTVVQLTNAVQLGGGGDGGYAVMADGTARAWGGNSDGTIGDGTTTARPTPIVIPGLNNVVSIGGGVANTYAITAG